MELIPLTELTNEYLQNELAHLLPRGEVVSVGVRGVVRKSRSAEFSTVFVTAGERTYPVTQEALRQLADLMRVPGAFLKQLPDEILTRSLDFLLGKLAQKFELAGLISEGSVVAWVRRDRDSPLVYPDGFLRRCRECFPPNWRLMGKPLVLSAGRVVYRFTTQDFSHTFEESPVPDDRYHFAVEIILDHFNLAPAQLGAFAYREVCSNGMIVPVTGSTLFFLWQHVNSLFQQIQEHLHWTRVELIDRIRETMVQTVDGRAGLAALTRGWPRVVRDAVARAFDRLEVLGETQYRLMNALSAAANTPNLDSYWQRRLATLAGEVGAGLRCLHCWQRLVLPTGRTS